MTEPRSGDLRGFLTGLMMAGGFLIVALSGTCTLFFTVGALADLARGHSGGEFPATSILALAAMFGAPPILVGGLLIWGASRLRRRSRPPPSAPPPG